MNQPRELTIGVDFVSWIGQTIQELAGFDTLANELIQNADDAPACAVTFDVRDAALVVWNDGSFSRCEDLYAESCSWIGKKGFSCDLHRFRRTASGDKRAQQATTGAFGIGFTAVYAVTDSPELHTAGVHWVIDPARQRVSEVSTSDPETGTRLELAWAKDEASPLARYRRLIRDEDVNAIIADVTTAVPLALPFLRNVRQVSVLRNGERVAFFERTPESGGDVLVAGPARAIKWSVYRANFDDDATAFRERESVVEKKRRSDVAVAFCHSDEDAGRYYATLPTKQLTNLGFSVNADFYPKQDRKRLLFDAEPYKSWNEAAIRAAASAVASNLENLRSVLGSERLWNLILSAKHLSDQAESAQGDSIESAYWDELKESIERAEIAITSRGDWRAPKGLVLVDESSYDEWTPVLEALGIEVASSDVARVARQLPGLAGAARLDLSHVVPLLRPDSERYDGARLAAVLNDHELSAGLWRLLQRLLEVTAKSARDTWVHALSECRIGPTTAGKFERPSRLLDADLKTRQLFLRLCGEERFLDRSLLPEGDTLFAKLVRNFDLQDAVEALEARSEQAQHSVLAILHWFSRNEDQLTPELQRRLSALPLFPTSHGLRAIDGLYLAGGFDDPLRLAGVLDLTEAPDLASFVNRLGARQLDIGQYVVSLVPSAVAAGLGRDARLALRDFMAAKLGEIRDVSGALEALSELALIECEDQEFRPASAVYFADELVAKVLKARAPIAHLPANHQSGVRELYRWLGVATRLRASDLAEFARSIIAGGPPTPSRKEELSRVLRAVQDLTREAPEEAEKVGELLSNVDWLPATRDVSRWYAPSELFDAFNQRLFESQGRFLDLPRPVQAACREALRVLGVGETPSVRNVVDHILAWSRRGRTDLFQGVYLWLAPRSTDAAVDALRGTPSLLINGVWRRPDEVFWSDPGLGRFATHLSPEWGQYRSLLDALGVQEEPSGIDAARILTALADETGNSDIPLDDKDEAVVWRCWSLLADAANIDQLIETHELNTRRVAPDRRGVLRAPRTLFFDTAAGLSATFGGRLATHIIDQRENVNAALERAGVRDLWDSIEVRILERVRDRLAPDIEQRLHLHQSAIERVVDSVDRGAVGRVRRMLSDITAVRCDALLVQYAVEWLGVVEASEPFESECEFDQLTMQLYLATSSEPRSWSSVAQVLAREVLRGTPNPTVALSLMETLKCESVEEGQELLDAIGFHRLSTTPAGIESDIADRAWESEPLDDLITGEQDHQSAGNEGHGTSVDGSGECEPESPAESADGGAPDDSGSKPAVGGPPRSHRERSRRGRLRSYVEQTLDTTLAGETAEAAERQERNSATDQAGVRRVLADEHDEGRMAVEMPHEHPGYDVESCDEHGTVRYIEVKSKATAWDGVGVALTSRQFERARELRTAYWLYVVELAGTDQERVFRIQDPAGRIDQYFFDDGWREAGT
jgi:hypothetical protein